jgi:peroxiredoxin
MANVTVGMVAPDFELENQHRALVKLSSFRGSKNVVIVFHPLAFTPVCTVQMKGYQEAIADFTGVDAHILSISCDPGPSKKAWADSLGGISYDLLTDFEPKGAVTQAYGVMHPAGFPERALFVVDKNGVVVWTAQYDIPEQPPMEALLDQLQQIARSQ